MEEVIIRIMLFEQVNGRIDVKKKMDTFLEFICYTFLFSLTNATQMKKYKYVVPYD